MVKYESGMTKTRNNMHDVGQNHLKCNIFTDCPCSVLEFDYVWLMWPALWSIYYDSEIKNDKPPIIDMDQQNNRSSTFHRKKFIGSSTSEVFVVFTLGCVIQADHSKCFKKVEKVIRSIKKVTIMNINFNSSVSFSLYSIVKS